jgi:hypothetical protein
VRVISTIEGATPAHGEPPQRSNAGRRSCTEAEAKVIGSLLAAIPESERARIRRSGLSARTYEVARQRVLGAGWVYERDVPDPRIWGIERLRFELRVGQPSGDIVTQWGRRNDSIFVLEADGLALGLFADLRGTSAVRLAPDSDRGRSVVTAPLSQPSVPVYFDFEGAWAEITGGPAPSRYPRSVPAARSFEEDSGRWSLGRREFRDVQEQVTRQFRTNHRHLGPLIGRKGKSRTVAQGLVQRRAFLNLARFPGYGDWRLQRLGFVHGRLRPGFASASGLFRDLVGNAGMRPFLYVTDGAAFLIGGLSPIPKKS